MNNHLSKAAMLSLALAASASAQIVLVEFGTFGIDGGSFGASSGTEAPRFYGSAGIEAPVGRTVWFVADRNSDGVPTSGVTPSTILGADDVRVATITVGYGMFVPSSGQAYGEGIPSEGGTGLQIDNSGGVLTGSRIYAYVWSGSTEAFVPDFGATYGVAQVSTHALGGIGQPDFFWAIDANVVGNQFTVVPEPSEYAAVAAATLAGFGLWRRRNHRRAN